MRSDWNVSAETVLDEEQGVEYGLFRDGVDEEVLDEGVRQRRGEKR